MATIKIYILTHKKFNYDENELYEPILNGSALLEEDFGYTRDDTGDNISELNPYYAELTGEYWVWKNSNVDIVGFCHYRRFFFKNIFLKRLEKKDIENILNKYDIILPHKRHLKNTIIESANVDDLTMKLYPDLNHIPIDKPEDYYKLRDIVEKISPEYLEAYDKLMNSKEIYWYNMLICKKELFDDYFNWLYKILEEYRKQTDMTKYNKHYQRILGYLSERLLNVYVIKHELKVKEKYVVLEGLRAPRVSIIANRFPTLQLIFNKLLLIRKKL